MAISGIRKPGFPNPSRYKYIINHELAGRDKFYGSDITGADIVNMLGPDAKDYHDLTQVAKGFYSQWSQTLSRDLNPFYEFVAASGGIEDVKHNKVRWKVFGDPHREITSFGNPNPETAECLGAMGAEFYIRVDLEYLKIGDIIAPVRNKRSAVVIVDEGKPSGGATEYKVKMQSQGDTFDPLLLKAGDYWIRLGNQTSYLESGQVGSFDFGFQASYVEFEVDMNTMQWEYTVSEDAWLKYGVLEVTRCDEGRNPIPGASSLTNMMETEAKSAIQSQIEMATIYGTGTRHHTDLITGQAITTAPGLMEFVEQAQEVPYSTTSQGIDTMIRRVKELWYDTIPISQRSMMLYTGEPGLELFHNWIMEKYGSTTVVTKEDLILGSSTPFEVGRNGRSFNNLQFTKYKCDIFGEITVAHWPLLDNTRVNGVYMPGTNYPVSAYEFWAFDIGFGEPNIKLLTRNNKELTQIIPGTIAPNGYVTPSNPIFKAPTDPNLHGYKWRHRKSFGLVVMEPDRLVRFIPKVAY